LFLADVNGCDSICPKVLDFGIARVASESNRLRLTGEGAAVGTPLYMSPEQVQNSAEVDQRADVYALGVIMFECLSGRFPFMAESYGALMGAIMHDPPASLSALAPDLPKPVTAVVHRAIARDPRARFPTAQELFQAYDAAVATASGAERVSADPHADTLAVPSTAPSALPQAPAAGAKLDWSLARRSAPAPRRDLGFSRRAAAATVVLFLSGAAFVWALSKGAPIMTLYEPAAATPAVAAPVAPTPVAVQPERAASSTTEAVGAPAEAAQAEASTAVEIADEGAVAAPVDADDQGTPRATRSTPSRRRGRATFEPFP
jgi:serine/threonine-protein kinase